VQREIELGLAPGEAFERFGTRCELEELRGLAAVLIQAERFGAGVAKSLRLHADTWRLERQQRAEERAHRAAVLILFPMLICIFPAIFIVTLAPAVFQMANLFTGGR
jgi:tight adherence protein C